MFSEKGQTLIELIVVVTMGVIIVGALTFATISSLRNAQFAKEQAQATKLAQEAIERVRLGRDRDSLISNFTLGSNPVTSWSNVNMWGNVTQNCSPCYFLVAADGSMSYKGTSLSSLTPDANSFTTGVILSDSSATCSTGSGNVPCYTVEKIITAQVQWRDFAGTHDSKLDTVLRKL